MGLDNGFVCKNIKREDIPSYVHLPCDWDEGQIEQEICYFRKHWGIRGEILAKIHCMEDNDSYTNVDSEDIIPIVKILMNYLDKEYYEDNDSGIWEYDEAKDNIERSIINLLWLKTYMDSHKDVSCYFYDSY
jgi:hypothetical protein